MEHPLEVLEAFLEADFSVKVESRTSSEIILFFEDVLPRKAGGLLKLLAFLATIKADESTVIDERKLRLWWD